MCLSQPAFAPRFADADPVVGFVFSRPTRLRIVNRLMGSVLVGMGALMAAVR
jgi:threonine/homoserine/homoserine lactone efflux protein